MDLDVDRDVDRAQDPSAGMPADLAARVAADPALRSAVLGLTTLDLAAGGYTATLTGIAALATCALPRADSACVVVDAPDADASAATTPLADELERISLRLHEGPHVSAQDERCPVCSGALGVERRWPRFGPRAGRLGIHSALSVPLVRGGAVLATLDVFAHDRRAFDTASLETAHLYGVAAAASLSNAAAIDAARRRADQLEQALASRAVIERAVGILISRSGISADEAFDRLRAMSQRQHRKVATLAQAMVLASAGRARARHGDDGDRPRR